MSASTTDSKRYVTAQRQLADIFDESRAQAEQAAGVISITRRRSACSRSKV
jgi:hypothetical protein